MEHKNQDTVIFFEKNSAAYPLYEALEAKLLKKFPHTAVRVGNTQITFSNRNVYACVSFQRVIKKADLPSPYLVLTLGLSYPLESGRVAAKTEPYPGRWTTHIIVAAIEEIDDELLLWLQQAYCFAESK